MERGVGELRMRFTSEFHAQSGLMAQQSMTTSRATAGSTMTSSKPLAAAQRSFT